MLEAKIALKKAMEQKKPKSLVYELFAKYEDCYAKLHNPSAEHQNDYITLYFQYLGYMQMGNYNDKRKR